MGSEGDATQRKPRFLCLHGFRTSGRILKKQVFDKWPTQVVEKLDLVFVDAPFPCQGKSEVEGIFDPPYYEWFQFDKEFREYQNFDKCLAYIEECFIKHGPFEGLLGFSQGAILSGALPGLQEKGVALTKVPKIKYLIIIGGAQLKNESLAEKAYSSSITCPSVHFLGAIFLLVMRIPEPCLFGWKRRLSVAKATFLNIVTGRRWEQTNHVHSSGLVSIKFITSLSGGKHRLTPLYTFKVVPSSFKVSASLM